MATRLSFEEIGRYRRGGYLCPVKVLEPGEAADRRARLEAMEASRGGRLPPSLNAKPHLLVPWLWDMVHEPRIVDAIEGILGPDIMCWGTSFISKSSNDNRYVAWHQDATYWGLSEPLAVTAWVALTPSTAENGCVRVVPGTHQSLFDHTDSRDSANLLGRGEKMVDDVDPATAVDLALEPGEMSLHHCLVVHGSAPNVSSQRRVGFAIRYVPASVSQKNGARNSATLVRGRHYGHFDLEQAPEGEFHPEAMRRHTISVRQGMRVIFEGAPSRSPPDGGALPKAMRAAKS